MTDLLKKLQEKAAFQWTEHVEYASDENSRLTPILTALIRVVEIQSAALEAIHHTDVARFHKDLCEKTMGCHCPKTTFSLKKIAESKQILEGVLNE